MLLNAYLQMPHEREEVEREKAGCNLVGRWGRICLELYTGLYLGNTWLAVSVYYQNVAM